MSSSFMSNSRLVTTYNYRGYHTIRLGLVLGLVIHWFDVLLSLTPLLLSTLFTLSGSVVSGFIRCRELAKNEQFCGMAPIALTLWLQSVVKV